MFLNANIVPTTFEDKEKLDKHSKKAHTGREKPDQPH